jgi:predicted tellurium resistance membrane protein TerC
MFESLMTLDAALALLTLTAMEVVLGIDNIVFISILVAKVPDQERARIRSLGIFLALFMRLALLFSLSWLMGLTDPLFTLFEHSYSARDMILLGGGLFLIGKATFEIHEKVEGEDHVAAMDKGSKRNHLYILLQIILLDIVFSLDSVITAIGMVSNVTVMVIAMVISMIVMLVSSRSIGVYIEKNPTIKILALSFLLLIGVMLVFEGMGGHMDKGYIYFAMFFSLAVEMLNIRYRSRRKKSVTSSTQA